MPKETIAPKSESGLDLKQLMINVGKVALATAGIILGAQFFQHLIQGGVKLPGIGKEILLEKTPRVTS